MFKMYSLSKTNKFNLALLAGAVLLAQPLATASEFGGKCKDKECKPVLKKQCFNVFCRFEKAGHGDRFSSCESGSTFWKWTTESGDEVEDRSEPGEGPTFSVDCDGQRIFSSTARRFTESFGTRIQAVGGPYPATVLPQGALSDVPRYVRSSLELSDQTLKGYCFVYTGPQILDF